MVNEVQQPQQQPAGGREMVNIKEMGTPSIPIAAESDIHCLTIIGQIEDKMLPHNKTTKYEHVIPQLVAIEEIPAADTEYCGRHVEAGLPWLNDNHVRPTVSLC